MNKTNKQSTRLKAMTLTELLVVMAILGILILIAFPIVTPLFQKARSQEAKLNLTHLVGLQKIYYMEHAKYAANITDVGFEHNVLESEGGKANYKVEIKEANETNFKATATAVKDFDGDGTFNVWEIDKAGIPKEQIPD